MKKFLSYYQHNRLKIILVITLLILLASWAKFLWDIDARNIKSTCWPDRTYWSCFNERNLGQTVFGSTMYSLGFYRLIGPKLIVFIVLFELMILSFSRKKK